MNVSPGYRRGPTLGQRKIVGSESMIFILDQLCCCNWAIQLYKVREEQAVGIVMANEHGQGRSLKSAA